MFFRKLSKNLENTKILLLTLLHLKWPKLYGVLAILSAIGLNKYYLLIVVVVVLLFYVHSKYLRSCPDGQLT